MKIGDKYKIKIIDEDNIGNGIAKIDNFVIFIKSALKDEEIEIKIIKINKHYAVGKILNIISKSNKRLDVECKYYDICGGCNFLHTTYSNEINNKINYLEKLFNTKINYLINNNELYYRNKVTFHVLNGKLGYFNDKTHNLCEIDYCYLLNPKINLKLNEIKKYNLDNINEIMIRCISDKIMINICTNNENIDLKNIDCDCLYINNKYIKGEKYLVDTIDNIKYSIYPNSFYQVNNEVMKLIYDKAKSYIGNGDTLLDLYCGTGTIGIYLKDNFKHITGLEINSTSIENANINLKLNNINNIEFINDDAKNIKGSYDAIIVDPPRSGLSNDVIEYLNNSNSNKIVYISCNPNTLKRDIDKLDNYILDDISAASMFPRTKHIECVCKLVIKGE